MFVGVYFIIARMIQPNAEPRLDAPSPALGQTVANAVHAAVTDPYFLPVERFRHWAASNEDPQGATVDLLTNFAPDDLFPTCFVLNLTDGSVQVDHPASPWVMEAVVERVRQSLRQGDAAGRIAIAKFHAEGRDYWLGYAFNPPAAQQPLQAAGAFFDIDRYLDEDVPRLLDNLLQRRRFPLFPMEKSGTAVIGEEPGHLALKILKRDGSVYLQRGKTFGEDKLIYAESRYYDDPIVCLQPGWDLQVFSANAASPKGSAFQRVTLTLLLAGAVIVVSIAYWWGGGR